MILHDENIFAVEPGCAGGSKLNNSGIQNSKWLYIDSNNVS
jgi:hypothetical protein